MEKNDTSGGNVVTLKRPAPEAVPDTGEEIVLQCGECGCQSFYLNVTGKVECTSCHNDCTSTVETEGVEWRKNVPTPDLDNIKEATEVVTSHMFSDEVKYTRLRNYVEKLRDKNNIGMLIVYDKDGFGETWTKALSPKLKAKLMERLDDVRTWLSTLKTYEKEDTND